MNVATQEGETDSKPAAAALSVQQLQQVLEFLDAAPEEVAGWAGEQAAPLRAELAVRETGPGAAPVRAPGDGGDPPAEDESEDFYAGLENDDDILHRKVKVPAASGPRTTSPSGGGRVFTMRFALVVALLAGILGGVWYAARPTTSAPTTATPTLGTGTAPTEADVAVRIAELEARVAEDGNDVDARLELGVLYFNQGQTDAAKAQWLTVTELAPDNATAWYNLGFYYLTIQPADMAAAKAAWQRVIDIDPESEMARTASMHLAGLEDPTAPSPTPTEGR